jgi:SAM-dependent methyltransferase
MPYLLQSQNGALRGKSVLDIACNSGFWSLQCALLGAEVVGFDGRAELIEQANLIRRIVGLSNVEFRVLDYWDMSPQTLGGTFDIVLNLGILYHLPKPLEALESTMRMSRDVVLLDTELWRAEEPVIWMRWEEPYDIRSATRPGMIAYPSKSGLDIMLKHIGAAEWREIPIRTTDMPADYLKQRRASWLIKV